MIAQAQENLSDFSQFDFKVADVQHLSFADKTFDIVIANMMLHHVPNLAQALGEIHRVLKTDGRLYAATFGNQGAMETIHDWLGLPMCSDYPFVLQNGQELLMSYFSEVQKEEFEDSFWVTNLDDLVIYVASFRGIYSLEDWTDQELRDVFATHQVAGGIRLPKDYGLFIARK